MGFWQKIFQERSLDPPPTELKQMKALLLYRTGATITMYLKGIVSSSVDKNLDHLLILGIKNHFKGSPLQQILPFKVPFQTMS